MVSGPLQWDGPGVDTFPMTETASMQVSLAEMGDLTRVGTDEESLPPAGQEVREVFHMGSDVDDSPVSQPARSTSMLRANRFSPLSAEIDDEPLLSAVGVPSRRRLTLVGVCRGGDAGQRAEVPILESFDETHSRDGVSDVEMVDPGVSQDEADFNVNDHRMSPAIREALVSLDHVDLVHMISRRAILMKCPPQFLRGAYKSAMRLALTEFRRQHKVVTKRGVPEHGNCFFCCHDCCCSAPREEG